MVVGMERFREHFRGLEHAFVLIGGAACEAWMSRSGLPFRRMDAFFPSRAAAGGPSGHRGLSGPGWKEGC